MLLRSCHLRELSVDSLETCKHLRQLTFADLEHDLLVLLVALASLVFLQVHLDVQSRLLHSVFLARTNLHIHPPVEIAKLGQRGELVLQVHLRWFSDFSHHLEKERLDLLREGFREFRGEFIFVLHSNGDVLFEECVEGENQDKGLLVRNAQRLRQCPKAWRQRIWLQNFELAVECIASTRLEDAEDCFFRITAFEALFYHGEVHFVEFHHYFFQYFSNIFY